VGKDAFVVKSSCYADTPLYPAALSSLSKDIIGVIMAFVKKKPKKIK
jgi:hypothetical protein